MVIKRNKDIFSNNSKDNDKISYNFDFNTLSLFLEYILSDNNHIRRSDFIKLKTLIDSLDYEVFKADQVRLKLLDYINKGLEARIEKKLSNRITILTYIKGGITEDDIEELNNLDSLTDNEVEYVSNCISNALSCSVMQNEMEKLKKLSIEYDMADYKAKSDMANNIRNLADDLHYKFMQCDIEVNSTNEFHTDPNMIEDSISFIYDQLSNPGRFLHTQMQGFDMMFGGGLEGTRFYLLAGLAGIGKSMFMLNLALQIRQANTYFVPKDVNKKPIILFLTQENSVAETVERIFKIFTGNNITKYSKEQVMNILTKKEALLVDDENNIALEIIYKPDRSISTADLEMMIEEYESNGKEIVCVFQDHIKRIRSRENINDQRLELGAVVNEFKNIANRFNIPIVSVAHLNRSASSIIDSGMSMNEYDLTRSLGRDNIGESYLMIDNADAVAIISKEYDEEETPYAILSLLKLRYAEEILKYMAYPMKGLKILTDSHLTTPIYKQTLRPEAKSIQGVSSYTQNTQSIFSGNQTFKSMDDLANEDIFNSNSQTFTAKAVQNNPVKINITPQEYNITNDGRINVVEWMN